MGERRNYLAALLTLDPRQTRALAREQGWPEDSARWPATSACGSYLRSAIERDVNPQLASFETIKRFAVLPQTSPSTAAS